MSRSDDLRHTLHDPHYWLGPEEPLGARVFAAIGIALGVMQIAVKPKSRCTIAPPFGGSYAALYFLKGVEYHNASGTWLF